MKKAPLLYTALLFLLVTGSCSTNGGNGAVVYPPEKAELGSSSAPITIEVFSDYECPACGYFENTVFPQIQSNLVDTGKARFVFHDFPLPGHHDALPAAIGSYCAMDQGKYWEMHMILFENQQNLSPASIKGYAKTIGLDEEVFGQCVNNNKYRSYVQMLFDEGNKLQIMATPTIMINGNKLDTPTVPTFEQINSIVESL